LGNGVLTPGARPDVAIAHPGYPHNNWGWGAQILTNTLPGTNGLPMGNGTYKLHAIAADTQAPPATNDSRDCACTQSFCTDLGTTTISADNAHSILPFGTIDTPGQGQIISGTDFLNFGWVLTPQPNIVPFDASTIMVYIDNLPVGHPVYNNFRPDIAGLFPGLKNSSGGVGYFHIDTTKLSNGILDWNADFFGLLKANGMSVVCSFSQELVNPPDNPPSSVWVQRFPDGQPVETATGFGTLNSSQIAFSSGPQNYLGQAHAAMAGLMLAAGLTPKLQFGEILWWFQANAAGMAFYDVDTKGAAQSALGRALATFTAL
jgi:hypothetical protein